MKIMLKNLQPNPFKKNINGGKLNQEKVDKLKESIGKDGFWAGLMCREAKGAYQIPFGHHRTEAAKQVLGADHEIDIPVRDLSDEQMVRMLANENAMQSEEPTIYQFDLVVMTRNWLSQHIKPRQGKGATVSARDISQFLGERNWSERRVSEYLRMRDNLSPAILKELKNASAGGVTVANAKAMTRLPINKQEEICEEIQDKDITYSEMDEAVTDIGEGVSVKEAVKEVVNNRKNRKVISKDVSLKARRIAHTCGSLIMLVKKNPLVKHSPKDQDMLRTMFSQLIKLLTKDITVLEGM